MKKWLCGISLFLACVSAHAAVRPTLLWCDGCTAPQKRAKAATQSVGDTVYVGDTVTNTFTAYSVGLLLDDSYSPPRQVVSPHAIAADPALNPIEDALLDFYHAAPVGWRKSLQFSSTEQFINVYDVVFAGPSQNILLDWVASQTSVRLQEIPIRVEQMASFFRIGDASKMPAIRITVIFVDGSKIDIDVDYSTTNADFKIVENSGIDSHHNPVLSSRTNKPGQYDFRGPGDPSDYNEWQRWMTTLGYSIPLSAGFYWACTNDPMTGYHCVHIY